MSIPFPGSHPAGQSVVTNAIRGLTLGQAALPANQTVTGQVVLGLALSLGLSAIFALLAVHIYRLASH